MTKSMVICDQGWPAIGKDQSTPEAGWLEVLFCAQTGQAEMYSRTSLARVGH